MGNTDRPKRSPIAHHVIQSGSSPCIVIRQLDGSAVHVAKSEIVHLEERRFRGESEKREKTEVVIKTTLIMDKPALTIPNEFSKRAIQLP
jgi:hypothetical protein